MTLKAVETKTTTAHVSDVKLLHIYELAPLEIPSNAGSEIFYT